MDEEQRRQAQISEMLDSLYEMRETLPRVLNLKEAADEEVLTKYDQVIKVLEDRAYGPE